MAQSHPVGRQLGAAMTLSGIIDLAISLILMYLLISLICTTINELIASLFKMRASMLKGAVEMLVDDPVLKQAFDANGLVKAARAAAGDRDPSYLDGRTFAMAILGSLNTALPIPAVANVANAVAALPVGSRIGDAIRAGLTTAGQDITKLRDEVANWFDSAMDRLSGQYQRRIKKISFLVGLVLAIILNADSLAVSRILWNDAGLRTGIADIAADAVSKCKADPKCVLTAQPPPASSGNLVDDVKSQVTLLESQVAALRPLPIGWHASDAVAWQGPDARLWILLKILGLLWTAAALTLGAPFWFDLLSMFVSIRGTGAKPEKASKQT
jgi:hypothetical protein